MIILHHFVMVLDYLKGFSSIILRNAKKIIPPNSRFQSGLKYLKVCAVVNRMTRTEYLFLTKSKLEDNFWYTVTNSRQFWKPEGCQLHKSRLSIIDMVVVWISISLEQYRPFLLTYLLLETGGCIQVCQTHTCSNIVILKLWFACNDLFFEDAIADERLYAKFCKLLIRELM